VKSWITDPRQSQNSGAVEAQNEAMKGCGRSQMEAWRASRPVVADSRHTDEQDLDLHSYSKSKKADPNPQLSDVDPYL
jgi:hypothetical protein